MPRDMIAFLKCFEDRCAVVAASNLIFGSDESPVYRHPSIPGMAREAFTSGWLLDFYGKEDIPPPEVATAKGIPLVFFMELELTAAGREECGLPPLVKAIPIEPVKVPKTIKAAKKMAAAFDFGE